MEGIACTCTWDEWGLVQSAMGLQSLSAFVIAQSNYKLGVQIIITIVIRRGLYVRADLKGHSDESSRRAGLG